MSAVLTIVRDPLAIALMVVFAAMMVTVLAVREKILKPLRVLTGAAKNISQGNIDVEIPSFSGSKGEIAAMSAALNRVVGLFRVHALMQAQAQAVTAARLQFSLFVKEANSVPQAFRMALSVLRYQYEPLKITAVYTNPNPAYTLSYHKDDVDENGNEIREAESFQGHAEVMSLLAGKRIVFMNAFVMKKRGVSFTGGKTEFVCLVSLVAERRLPGYIIIESEERGELSVVKEERFLLQVADGLSGWISTHKDASQTAGTKFPLPAKIKKENIDTMEEYEKRIRQAAEAKAEKAPEKQSGALPALRELSGLDVDTALRTMGGLEDVYERAVRLFAKLLPETLEKTDNFWKDGNIKSFAVEIHGIKGSLNNMGALALGGMAARIEDAAKSGDAAFCEENYPRFKGLLTYFHGKLAEALPPLPDIEKLGGDTQLLKSLLERAVKAAEAFDAFEARRVMSEAAGFTYGPEADSLLGEITASLERFNCEGAARLMGKLGETIEMPIKCCAAPPDDCTTTVMSPDGAAQHLIGG